MEAPHVHGERLALVVGSALSAEALAPRGARRDRVDLGDGRGVDVLATDDVVVLARHGLDGFIPAHRIDHHVNVGALVAAGCDRVVALASVGTLHAERPVGAVVAIDDVLALGWAPTYFDDARGHRVPGVDEAWRATVVDAWRAATATPLATTGTYAMTSGPRFETPAEIRLLATHADVVGMTVAPELFLAGEAGLAYAALCQVDNLANGLGGEALTVAAFEANVAANRQRLVADATALTIELAGRPRP